MTEAKALTSIEQLLAWARRQLEEGESPALDARVLLCHCMRVTPTFLMTWPEKTVPCDVKTSFMALVKKRQQGMPVAYLTGTRDFWTLRLACNPDTLIPRPETELLIEAALGLDLPDNARILDLGTGTGAIALALASEKPGWQISGVDKQPGAVELARQNAIENDLSHVQFLQSDWFSQVAGHHFDLIVSNPPYVETTSPYLKQGDVRFEPLSALVSGEDGLDDIRLIVSQASTYLSQQGYLMFEHGYQQGPDIQQILRDDEFVNIDTLKDFNQLPRCTFGRNSH